MKRTLAPALTLVPAPVLTGTLVGFELWMAFLLFSTGSVPSGLVRALQVFLRF